MLIVTKGQSRFLWFCPYLHYTGIFLHVNKACFEPGCFIDPAQQGVPQNKSQAGNGSVPSHDGDLSISL